jgi:hypothetical protein
MRKFNKHKWWILTVMLMLPAVVIAAIPYQTFTPGTPISSTQLASDFQNIESRLAALEAKAPPALNCQIVLSNAQPWLAQCPTNYFVTGGGCTVANTAATPGVNLTYPPSATSWTCDVGTNSPANNQFTYAICCKIGP